jgi:hypothetical protein
MEAQARFFEAYAPEYTYTQSTSALDVAAERSHSFKPTTGIGSLFDSSSLLPCQL